MLVVNVPGSFFGCREPQRGSCSLGVVSAQEHVALQMCNIQTNRLWIQVQARWHLMGTCIRVVALEGKEWKRGEKRS